MPFLAVLLLLSLPAAAVGPAQAVLLNATPPGRNCYPAESPRQLPLLEELLNGRKVDALMETAGPLLLSLHFDGKGRLASVVALESQLPAGSTAAAISAARNAVRVPQHGEPGDGPWAVRLRIVAAGVLKVERSAYCAPEAVESRPALLDGIPLTRRKAGGPVRP